MTGTSTSTSTSTSTGTGSSIVTSTGAAKAPDVSRSRTDVLIPTCDRPAALAVTLTALTAQDRLPARVVISDQSTADPDPGSRAVLDAALRRLRSAGTTVEVHRHLPKRGMAEQRAYLLAQVTTDRCLFLDDDVVLDPPALRLLDEAMTELRAGVVGMAPQALSHLDRPRPLPPGVLELWDGPVTPERIRKGDPAWERWQLGSAAALRQATAQLELGSRGWVAHKICWLAGCVLFDVVALRATGGFDFWRELPPAHRGEDVVSQLRVIEAVGGAGLVPSRAVSQELSTTVVDRRVDAYAVVLEGRSVAEATDLAEAGPQPDAQPAASGTPPAAASRLVERA